MQVATGDDLALLQRVSAADRAQAAERMGTAGMQHVAVDGLAAGEAAAGIANQQVSSNVGLLQAGLTADQLSSLAELAVQRDAEARAASEVGAAALQSAASTEAEPTVVHEVAAAALQQTGNQESSNAARLRGDGTASLRLGEQI